MPLVQLHHKTLKKNTGARGSSGCLKTIESQSGQGHRGCNYNWEQPFKIGEFSHKNEIKN